MPFTPTKVNACVKLCNKGLKKVNPSAFRRISVMENENKFGFVAFAETWNGRLAMLGFLIGVATEFLTGQGILSQIGLM
jgi:hypothetical protein